MKKYLVGFLVCFSLLLSTCAPNENVNFLSQVNVIPINDEVFVLAQKFTVQVDEDLFVVPQGFQTDFASIPRIFWGIAAPFDYKNIAPAILHDYQYSCPNNLSRSKIDSIFYSSLIDNRVNPIVAYVFWLAVRIGGLTHFNKDNHCAVTDKNYYKKISS
jgi:hypothetical protein